MHEQTIVSGGFRVFSALLLAALLQGATVEAATLKLEHLTFASGERAAQPSVTVDPAEGFIVTWQERDEVTNSLQFAVFDTSGKEQRRGLIARGSDWFINGADFPNLAVLDNGDWVSFWLQKSSPGTYSYDVLAVRSTDRGATWDSPLTIHRDETRTEHGFVSLLADGGDRVRAVWLDGRRMASNDGDAAGHKMGDGDSDPHEMAEHMTLRSAVFGRDRKLVDEQELDDLTCACCQTDAVRVGDRMLLGYRDRTPGEVRDIQLLEHHENKWSQPRVLHADGWVIAGCPVNGPALAAQGETFAMLWPTMGSGEMQLRFAIGDDAKRATTMLAAGPAELGRLDLAAWSDGRWLATRVASTERVPTLWLSQMSAEGASVSQHQVAAKVGGYPRLASHAGVALLAWAEQGGRSGTSRIGIVRISDASDE